MKPDTAMNTNRKSSVRETFFNAGGDYVIENLSEIGVLF
jgi:hypothetical protein